MKQAYLIFFLLFLAFRQVTPTKPIIVTSLQPQIWLAQWSLLAQ
jgi:hypothetical protein